MKLWHKISLICSAVLLTMVLLCTRTLTNWAKEEMISQSFQSNYEQLRELKGAFEQQLSSHADMKDSEAVRRALIEYCFSQLALEGSAISIEGELVYSRTDAPVMELVPLRLTDGVQSSTAGGTDGKIIISASAFRVSEYDDLECCIYLCKDILPLLARIELMRWRFALRGLAYAVLGLLLIQFLVKRNMRHLALLQKAASSIAGGDYSVRAKVETKDELRKLADGFNLMAEAVEHHVAELEETAERQRLFISAVSHEFKTPLTSILLNSDCLQNIPMTELERQNALAQISSQGRRLEALTQKMLCLITMREGIEPATISVPVLLDKLRESTAPRLIESGTMLDISCSMESVCGDETLLLSALINLVDNAAKASKPGQRIELSAHNGIFTVRDFGHGISPEAIPRVTEPFFMEDKARSRKNGGAGLGLALVDEIVKAHGGKLHIESTAGEGTTVKIILPGNKTVICR